MPRLLILLTLCLVVGTPLAAVPAAAAPAAATTAAQPSVASAKVSAVDRKRWKAPQGPFFNDPRRRKGWFRIERKVIDTIKHTPRGSTIRIAVYSFDRMPVAKALIAAHRRGVKVQMILNDHQYTKAMRAIRKEIGAKRYRSSFIYRCTAGCRSKQNQYNNMHTKFYSFSRAGRSKDVLAVGSANMMLNADIHQWNDLYFTSGDHELFRQFVRLFNDMRKDHSTRQPPQFFCGTPANGVACDDSVDKHTVWAWPKPSGPKNDLVLDLLGKVQCLTPDGAGGQKRSRIAVSMHTMRGKRGDYLAVGDPAEVDRGVQGARDVRPDRLPHQARRRRSDARAGGSRCARPGLDYNPDDDYDLNKDGKDDLILSYYSHQKYVAIQGNYNGTPDTHMIVTGSANWASLSPGNDELWMTIRGKTLTRKYVKNFNYQWRNKRNSRNAYTTTYVNFRVARTVRDEDGTSRTVWRTVRRPVTTIERDPYRKGPYWEAD